MKQQYHYAYASSKGSREVNQDSYYACLARSCFGEAACAAVCDGVGGLSFGERASGEMVRVLDRWFRLTFPGLIETGLTRRKVEAAAQSLFSSASDAICEAARKEGRKCGTTAAVFLAFARRGYVFHVGDSRVYSLTRFRVSQLTHDQTVSACSTVRHRKNLKNAGFRRVLLQCIGSGLEPVPEFRTKWILPGEMLLICSDGFSHLISPKEMHKALAGKRNVQEVEAALEHMIDTAILRGERDNMTVLAVWRH